MKKQKVIYLLSAFSFFLWWGGFTFYASFVVPTGMNILGSHVLMGFITQQVSIKLNIACAVAIILGVVYSLAYKNTIPLKTFRFMLLNLVIMGVLLIGLSVLHTYMDTSLDFEMRKVIDEPHFYLLHRIYLLTSAVMWIQGIIHIINFLKIKR